MSVSNVVAVVIVPLLYMKNNPIRYGVDVAHIDPTSTMIYFAVQPVLPTPLVFIYSVVSVLPFVLTKTDPLGAITTPSGDPGPDNNLTVPSVIISSATMLFAEYCRAYF